jgi:FkbH-like protein
MSDRIKELHSSWRNFCRSGQQDPKPVDSRLGLAGSFTVDPSVPFLGALLLEQGVAKPDIRVANFNQIARVCLDPASEFGDTALDAIVILWRIEDLADSSDISAVISARDTILSAIPRLREAFGGAIIVSLPPRPRPAQSGLAEFARSTNLEIAWFDTLSKTADLCRSLPNCYTVDLEAAITLCGERQATDHRKELLYRQPYTDALWAILSENIARIYRARRYEPKKCIVVDCDNTLWGGVIGEDGVGGVELSDDMPGSAFRLFQRQLVALRRSGIFVALNSKNNPDDVWQMFDQHSAMALKRTDISTSRINWKPKSENLREIAADLNIGLDALVFVDDSQFEIEEVRTHAPEVTCILVPEDIADLPVVMRETSRLFDRLNLTADDMARVDMMRQELERRDLSQKMTEAEFLASLELRVSLYAPDESDLARVAQLINKTNQFNVTTRRYSFAEVGEMARDGDTDVFCASVRDKFGDYGLVGVSIIKYSGKAAEADTVLMSCRVLGRGIETAMLSHALSLANARGAETLRGTYIPTRKNAMVADLFARHDFAPVETADAGTEGATTIWQRATAPLDVPSFLDVVRSRPA